MRTNIVIDDELLDEAFCFTTVKTKKRAHKFSFERIYRSSQEEESFRD